MCEDAFEDPSVKAVLFCVDSGGGAASGMFDLADLIFKARATKPTAAISDDACYSAAYCLASSAAKVFVTRTGGVGSIGVWSAHIDMSGFDKQIGIKVTYVFSGDKKVDGNPHEPLSGRAHDDMQAECDRIRQMFVEAVARNRGVDAQKLYDTEAGCFMAENSVPLLADQVGTLDDALSYLRGQIATAALEDGDPEVTEITDLTGGAAGPFRKFIFSQATPAEIIAYRAARLAAAIAPHKTATSNGSWDGPANEARLKTNQSASYYKRAYAWYDSKGDLTKKNAYKFIHHEVSSSGDCGAANVEACRSGIAVLNGARGGTTIPEADRKGVYAHLKKHLSDAGVDVPDYKGEAEYLNELQGAANDHFILAFDPWGRIDGRVAEPHIRAREFRHRLDAAREVIAEQFPDAVLAVRIFGSAGTDASRKVSGLVVPYGQMSSDLGGFKELYQRGCFNECLTNGQDIRGLQNHNVNYVLGRRSAGTARFFEQADGLRYEYDAPKTQWADDLLVSMRRGDIDQASAAFFILQHRWETRDGFRVRIVEKALMLEASVVTFAVYETTKAQATPDPGTSSEHAQLGDRLRLLALS